MEFAKNSKFMYLNKTTKIYIIDGYMHSEPIILSGRYPV